METIIKDFDWVLKCILSCKTRTHLYTCLNLIDNFRKKYKKLSSDEFKNVCLLNDSLLEIVKIYKLNITEL